MRAGPRAPLFRLQATRTTGGDDGIFQDEKQKTDPITRKWWFWTAVGGGAAVIGGGIFMLLNQSAAKATGATGDVTLQMNYLHN